jgi:hypothetical protein
VLVEQAETTVAILYFQQSLQLVVGVVEKKERQLEQAVVQAAVVVQILAALTQVEQEPQVKALMVEVATELITMVQAAAAALAQLVETEHQIPHAAVTVGLELHLLLLEHL